MERERARGFKLATWLRDGSCRSAVSVHAVGSPAGHALRTASLGSVCKGVGCASRHPQRTASSSASADGTHATVPLVTCSARLAVAPAPTARTQLCLSHPQRKSGPRPAAELSASHSKAGPTPQPEVWAGPRVLKPCALVEGLEGECRDFWQNVWSLHVSVPQQKQPSRWPTALRPTQSSRATQRCHSQPAPVIVCRP
eukprot:364385-Chlamydomonas_euryale.AAC.5